MENCVAGLVVLDRWSRPYEEMLALHAQCRWPCCIG